MTTLDFRKQRKNYLKVTLPDEAETSLSVLQPTKELFHKMVAMSEEVGGIAGSDLDALDEVYSVCAELMSRNKEGLVVSKSNLEHVIASSDVAEVGIAAVGCLQSRRSLIRCGKGQGSSRRCSDRRSSRMERRPSADSIGIVQIPCAFGSIFVCLTKRFQLAFLWCSFQNATFG